jgi:guanylate kinase
MFLRHKEIKGITYYYTVVNKWTKKGTRQKVIEYHGRLTPTEAAIIRQRLRMLRKTRNREKE